MSWDCEGSSWACGKCGARWKTGEPPACTCSTIANGETPAQSEQVLALSFSAAPKKDRAKLQRLSTIEGILEALVVAFDSVDQETKWGPARKAETKAKLGRLLIDTLTKHAEIGVIQSLSDGIARIEGEN